MMDQPDSDLLLRSTLFLVLPHAAFTMSSYESTWSRAVSHYRLTFFYREESLTRIPISHFLVTSIHDDVHPYRLLHRLLSSRLSHSFFSHSSCVYDVCIEAHNNTTLASLSLCFPAGIDCVERKRRLDTQHDDDIPRRREERELTIFLNCK